jgi:hypothetical protein
MILLASTGVAHAEDPLPASDSCGAARATGTLSAAEVAFEKARDAWTAISYPTALAYSVHVHAIENGEERSLHYPGEEDTHAGRIYTDRFSDEETAHPYAPPGFDLIPGVGLIVHGGKVKVSRDDVNPKLVRDILGAPHLSPTYSFGLRRAVAQTGAAAAGELTSIRAIGKTSVVARNYTIVCQAVTTEGGPELQLTLTPLRNPHDFRLRELWLDTESFLPKRLRTAGNFTYGAPLGADWLTTFRRSGAVIYIDREVALSTLKIDSHSYQDATIEFEGVTALVTPTVRTLIRQPATAYDLREP